MPHHQHQLKLRPWWAQEVVGTLTEGQCWEHLTRLRLCLIFVTCQAPRDWQTFRDCAPVCEDLSHARRGVIVCVKTQFSSYVFRGLRWLTLAMSMLSKCCSASRIPQVCSVASESLSSLFLWEASGQPVMQDTSFQQWLICSKCGSAPLMACPVTPMYRIDNRSEGRRGTLGAMDAQASLICPVSISPMRVVITCR